VLTNTAIYSLLPIVISDLTDGLTGFLVSTVLSVLFGEIIPQSICARHGLAIGANTVWLVRFLMVVLWPIAWPISKLLDCLLGKEIATAYSRKELTQLIDFHTEGKLAAGGDLNVDESTIIRNALRFSITHVDSVMTPLPKVYSVPIDAVLDERTMVSISKAGNSRVPVVDATRGHVVGILIIKTLFLLAPSMRVPVRSIIKAMGHKVLLIEHNTPLDVMLNTFQWGRSHIAVVRKQRDLCTPQELEADAKPFHAKQTHAHTGKTARARPRPPRPAPAPRRNDRHFNSFQPDRSNVPAGRRRRVPQRRRRRRRASASRPGARAAPSRAPARA
jgi:metal transporter CNNM